MANKILYCATVDYHFKAFHLPYMKWFKEQGWQVDVAASGNMSLPYTDFKYNLPMKRKPLHVSNIRAYKELKRIINQNKYSIIHCHTPLGGVLTRLAAREARKRGTKVIYTAHGFHFCRGSSLENWLVYYPIERHLSRYTDRLITINQEDYLLATNHRFKAAEINHIYGVGVNSEQFRPIDIDKRKVLKKSSGYQADDFLLFNVGEFNKNKNQQFLIRAMVPILKEIPHAMLLLAGEGALLNRCKTLAKQLKVSQRVKFLEFRNDIDEIMPMCDVAVSSSMREGLPVNIMEGMSCELPVVALDNRGHRELVHDGQNGWIVQKNDLDTFAAKIKILAKMSELKKRLGENGRKIIVARYSTNHVLKSKRQIYQTVMDGQEDVTWAIP